MKRYGTQTEFKARRAAPLSWCGSASAEEVPGASGDVGAGMKGARASRTSTNLEVDEGLEHLLPRDGGGLHALVGLRRRGMEVAEREGESPVTSADHLQFSHIGQVFQECKGDVKEMAKDGPILCSSGDHRLSQLQAKSCAHGDAPVCTIPYPALDSCAGKITIYPIHVPNISAGSRGTNHVHVLGALGVELPLV